MAGARHIQKDRARRFAVALASFCRAQANLPLHAVAESPECRSLASEVLDLATNEESAQRRKPAGRRPVHDRAFAKGALLDHVTKDPDGMAHQAALIRELERRYEATSRKLPGETWLKETVREFQAEAEAFELDAAATFHNSSTLQAIFGTLEDFLRFRRAKSKVAQIWDCSPDVRAQYASPEKLLEAAFHNGSTPAYEAAISAYSRLPACGEVESNPIIKRRQNP